MVNERLRKLLPPRSFRFVFSLMYLGVISTVVYFSLISRCQMQFVSVETGMLFIVFLTLAGLEQWERSRYDGVVPLRPAVMLLLMRMALVQAVVVVDCSGYAAFLYPLIPFSAYFSLGSRVSNAVTLGYVGWYFWQYRPLAVSGAGSLFDLMIFAVLMLFMLVLARVIDSDEHNQRNLELLLADLEASNVKLQLYAEQVAELAATEERNRLARDIHDSLGHRLTIVNIQLEKALAYKERNPDEAEQALLDAKQAASGALRDVRRSVSTLREADDGFSLRSALVELVEGLRNGRFSINFEFSGQEDSYSRPVLMALYRSAQEGLTNIQKHAQATAVKLTVYLEEAEGKLILQDNGRGFDATTLDELAIDQYHSFGLQGIQERLELVRGQMQVISRPGQGTILQITVPKNATVLRRINDEG
ncbi:MAG: sensor histidine kinase [Anaerolineae bacterium]|nr:sensor histidine kinase [Anaerolineae bacterium]